MANLYVPIRIIFADDHEVLRDGFQGMMKKQVDIEIISEAKNGEELIRLTRQLQPDIIVTDIQMPVINGIDATRSITKDFPIIGIIAFSMYNEEGLIVDMLKAGAKGYILKSARKEEIIAAIKCVHKGGSYYCKETEFIISGIRAKNRALTKDKIGPRFSDKEIIIIKLICQEFSNQEIAGKLGLSKRTIEGYREQIMEKANARNTAGVVLYAIKNKIYEHP